MNRFTQSAQNALNKSMYYAREMGHTYIGSEHLLLGLLSESDSIAAKILAARGIDFDKAKESILQFAGTGEPTSVGPNDMTPRTKRIIENSAYQSMQLRQNYIGTEHILFALISESDSVGAKIIVNLGISLRDIEEDIISFFRDFNSPGNCGASAKRDEECGEHCSSSGISSAKNGDNTLNNTPTLKQYGRDLTAMARSGKIDPIIGRDTETERVIQILSRRTKNNPCLIGEPGVGKTAVVEGLAQRIADGSVPETLEGKKIVTLDIASMIAGAKYRGEFEERMKSVMSEVVNDKSVILFIDEIHTIIGAGSAEGAVDAANILKPALARGEMQVIGATTITEYRKHIEKDAALERRFQSVNVGEPTPEEAVLILSGLRDKYEAHHKVKITDEAIDAAVKYSVRYVGDRYLPDKAIDLIDEAASKKRIGAFTAPEIIKEQEKALAQISSDKEEAIKEQNFEKAAALRDKEKAAKESIQKAKEEWKSRHADDKLSIGEAEIADIVTSWTGIPVSKLAEEEEDRLLHLDTELHKRIVGQNEAVDAVSRAIRRGRMGLKNPKRPMGSFIFLGPTGVGKTELCKALSETLFGDENAVIRVDMSEYMEKHSVSKMIGSPPGYVGYDEGGQLTEKVRRHPYSVILFDEIEKAHPDVFNILLQILEDGILTDAQGRRVDFKNTIIIMTSNVGANDIVTKSGTLGFGSSSDKNDGDEARIHEKVMQRLRDTFKPEFLNRIDEIIVFSKLGGDEIKQIARIMLGEVAKRLDSLEIKIEFDDAVVDFLSDVGVDSVYGARPLRREIQRRIEDSLSSEMLEGKIKKGDLVKAVLGENGNICYEVVKCPDNGDYYVDKTE